MQIIKRDGTKVEFNKEKIYNAIIKAMKYGSGIVNDDVAKSIADNAQQNLSHEPTIYEIEDYVYMGLIKNNEILTAKAYTEYKAVQAFKRETNTTDDAILGLIDYSNEEVMSENSNKDAVIVSTQRDLIAGEVSKDIARRKLLPSRIVQAHDNGVIHFHK